MAIVAPFRGITYNSIFMQEISRLVTPPYDVISPEAQEMYHREHPYNVIRLILGKKQVGDSDWDNRYTRAAEHFERWEREGILIRDEKPAIYITSLTYDAGNGLGEKTRWGFIALVKIEEEGSKVILPHERTFSAHKEDRLKLMRACNANFSQIFGLYEDSQRRIIKAFQSYTKGPPICSFEFRDKTKHQMWVVHEPEFFQLVSKVMANKSIFIADGHHRYETARNYRNYMRTRYGKRPWNRSYEFVMMYLTNISDPGLTILPSHRLIKRVPEFELNRFLEKSASWFHIEELPLSGNNALEDAKRIKGALGRNLHKSSILGFYPRGDRRCYIMTLKNGLRDQMGEDLHPSLKKLDVLVLSRFLLQKGLGFSREELDDDENFHYQSSFTKALEAIRTGGYEMAFFLNPTSIEHVKEVASNLLVMPRKSTFFYPKILTGLVFNKIYPHELIEVPQH